MKTIHIHGLLGTGVFGSVYKGIFEGDSQQRQVAIKTHPASSSGSSHNPDTITQMLRHECEILYYLAREHCPYIPQLIWFGQETTLGTCLAMEWLAMDFKTVALMQMQKRSSSSSSSSSATHFFHTFMVQAIAMLRSIHECGIVHRDIKPENFMQTHDGQHWKLIDFGLAGPFDDSDPAALTKPVTTTIVGTVRYISEAVHQGLPPTRIDDLISLGFMMLAIIQHPRPLTWDRVPKTASNDIPICHIHHPINLAIAQQKTHWIDHQTAATSSSDPFTKFLYQCSRQTHRHARPSYQQLSALF